MKIKRSNIIDGDPVRLALKIDRILRKSGQNDETRRKAIEFVWFSDCGRLMNWSDVRIRKDLPRRPRGRRGAGITSPAPPSSAETERGTDE